MPFPFWNTIHEIYGLGILGSRNKIPFLQSQVKVQRRSAFQSCLDSALNAAFFGPGILSILEIRRQWWLPHKTTRFSSWLCPSGWPWSVVTMSGLQSGRVESCLSSTDVGQRTEFFSKSPPSKWGFGDISKLLICCPAKLLGLYYSVKSTPKIRSAKDLSNTISPRIHDSNQMGSSLDRCRHIYYSFSMCRRNG